MTIEGAPDGKRLGNLAWSDLTPEEYNEALSETNMYPAEKSLGHKPSNEEALNYYIEHATKLHERLGINALKEIEDKE